MKQGIHHAYVGNVPGHAGNNTYCPKCGSEVHEKYKAYQCVKDGCDFSVWKILCSRMFEFEEVEQLGVAGFVAAEAEVAGGGDEALAEMMMPDAIDDDARGQRGRRDQVGAEQRLTR